jgi:ABC-type multidrug transport system fused ATPase/permease subunit
MAALLLAMLSPLLGIAMLWLLAKLVDGVFIGLQLQWLPWFVLACLAVACAQFAATVASRRLAADVHERVAQNIRVALYRHLMSMPPDAGGAHRTGDVQERLGSDTGRVSSLLFRGPVGCLVHLFQALCCGVFLFALNWKLACMALLVVPPLAMVVRRLSAQVRACAARGRLHVSQWMSLAKERLDASDLVHAFDTLPAEISDFSDHCSRARGTERQTVEREIRMSLASDVLTFVGGLAVITLAAHEVQSGLVSVGGVLAFLCAAGCLYHAVRSLSLNAGCFERAAASAERIASLMRTPSQVTEMPWHDSLPEFDRGRIDFQNVSFRYADGTRALDRLTLSVTPGESVALVGASGSGKSTVLRLLLRLHDPQEGAVSVNDIDIRSVSRACLRADMSAVLPEPHILSGTVAHNLRYGAPNASDAELLAAAHVAGVDSFVRAMPQGYASPLAAYGEGMTEGQRQRLALARALIRDAPILLIDESTSALDDETDALLGHAIQTVAGKRTVLVVTDRLAVACSVDRILVMSQGHLVESGSPAELLRRGTHCHRLFASQLADKVVPLRRDAGARAAHSG